ncbi:protease Lon-related BREX system protein BrxL [Methanomethylophilus alvi]|uniref:protease Lon-related BREX system protein BrxL n=1 Tax=Methanomethylophilus alvi TaxID=1291540 RepID=UPI0037DC384D
MGNDEILSKGFKLLREPLINYVCEQLKDSYGSSWWMEGVLKVLPEEQIRNLPNSGEYADLVNSLDVGRGLLLLFLNWRNIFHDKVDQDGSGLVNGARDLSKDLYAIASKAANIGGVDFDDRETSRALDMMYQLCMCFDKDQAYQIDCLYKSVGEQKSSDDGYSQGAMNVISSMPRRDLEPGPAVSVDVNKLIDSFEGCIVRKDLTKKIKEGANVPIFVLEYLLGMYCSSQIESEIKEGIEIVKDKLAKLYIRPDEAERVKSNIREAGEGYAIIDKVTVSLDYKKDLYMASFLSLGLNNVPINSEMVVENPRLLSGGIWCIVTFDYSYIEGEPHINPFKITRLSPIQMPFVDVDDYIAQRKNFTKDEWITLMLRSTGIESNELPTRTRMLLLARMMPLVENNINLCELGPRSTGKSHIYKEISPSSILVSGGQASVASLFYNLSTRTPGLVCNWDVVAFDEVAEIKFKDKDAITIMKDYMASGSFSRGGEHLEGKASMVFVGNINESIDSLLLQASLFKPFPVGMNEDTAFLDRMHCYIPGWEIEPFSPKAFTNDYGFICDYLAEIARELRKIQFSSIIDDFFTLDSSLKERDVKAVKKIVSAMMKLIYPDGNVDKEGLRDILEFALEMRSRVKEQLKRIQPDGEFEGVMFAYTDNETGEKREVRVPECVELEGKQHHT